MREGQRMINREEYIKNLQRNFDGVQGKINDILNKGVIDIKQISDLQRYVEMQKNITYSIYLLEGGE